MVGHCADGAAESTSPTPERAESTFFQTSHSSDTVLNLRNKGSHGEEGCSSELSTRVLLGSYSNGDLRLHPHCERAPLRAERHH
jgi:hypothetical protein